MAGSPADDLTFLQAFANLLGAPEPALRLLISILIGKVAQVGSRVKNYCVTCYGVCKGGGSAFGAWRGRMTKSEHVPGVLTE